MDGIPVTDADPAQRPSAVGEIEVRRAPSADADVIAAARTWALAFEAVQRQGSATWESTEIALYEAMVGVDSLKSAELALYEAVLAAESSR